MAATDFLKLRPGFQSRLRVVRRGENAGRGFDGAVQTAGNDPIKVNRLSPEHAPGSIGLVAAFGVE